MNVSPATGSPTSNQQIIDQIDGFIEGLTASASGTNVKVVSSTTVPVIAPRSDQEMKEFVLDNSAKLVECSVNTILQLQKLTIATGDAEMMGGLAGLIAASTAAIEAVNKMHLQNQKLEATKEHKILEIEGRKEVQRIKNEGNLTLPSSQTNILIATREEIIEKLTGKARAKAVVVDDTIEFSSLPTTSVSVLSAEQLLTLAQ